MIKIIMQSGNGDIAFFEIHIGDHSFAMPFTILVLTNVEMLVPGDSAEVCPIICRYPTMPKIDAVIIRIECHHIIDRRYLVIQCFKNYGSSPI